MPLCVILLLAGRRPGTQLLVVLPLAQPSLLFEHPGDER